MLRQVLCVSLVALVAALAVAAERPAPRRVTPRQPPAAPAVPQVTVFKLDATTVRGEVTASDPDSVTITPLAKPNATEPPKPVVVPWKEIRALSNGLTQAKAAAQWKRAHRDQLCETCRGERTVYCPTCKGTAHDPAAGKDCPKCHGELLVDCPGPRCDKGQIPCTNHCLQLTEGHWVKRDDNLRWRAFPLGRGTQFYSENHLGHIIQIDRAAGTATDVGTCPVCNGTTKVDCPVCHGQGKAPCAVCSARKDAGACPSACDHGRTKCPTCDGTGLKKTGEQPTPAEQPAPEGLQPTVNPQSPSSNPQPPTPATGTNAATAEPKD